MCCSLLLCYCCCPQPMPLFLLSFSQHSLVASILFGNDSFIRKQWVTFFLPTQNNISSSVFIIPSPLFRLFHFIFFLTLTRSLYHSFILFCLFFFWLFLTWKCKGYLYDSHKTGFWLHTFQVKILHNNIIEVRRKEEEKKQNLSHQKKNINSNWIPFKRKSHWKEYVNNNNNSAKPKKKKKTTEQNKTKHAYFKWNNEKI